MQKELVSFLHSKYLLDLRQSLDTFSISNIFKSGEKLVSFSVKSPQVKTLFLLSLVTSFALKTEKNCFKQ